MAHWELLVVARIRGALSASPGEYRKLTGEADEAWLAGERGRIDLESHRKSHVPPEARP